MWTPRRVGLLLLGVAVVVSAFVVYQFFLGAFDGLPALPEKYLVRGKGGEVVEYRVSTTIGQLQVAFGENSPEASSDVRVYKHRLPIVDRNGVMAIGSPLTDGTPRVVVAPVSVALFGARNAKVRPGEVPEATTMHADRAVILFDRPILRMEDMTAAKMLRLDLESEPDDDPRALAETKRDPRQGRIWVTNNRKSPDPADHLVLRTPGPLFVQLPNDDVPESPDTKHIWTAASVEVFDRRNLPRRLRSREAALDKLPDPTAPRSAVSELLHQPEPIPPIATVVTADDPRRYADDLRRYAFDLRRYDAVADILSGRTLPPPTAVGRGMSVRLSPAKRDPNASRQPNSFSGVHNITLGEGVLMCLWTDGNAGFPGQQGEPKPVPAATTARPLSPNADPPLGTLAVGGGLIDGGTVADRFVSRSLLVVSTPGAFQYDLEKSLATFDAAAIDPDGGQNFVVVTRLNARNETDDLICTRLELDLSDPDKGKTTPGKNPMTEGGGLVVRQVTASGPMVTLSAQAEGIEASCVKLVHSQDRDANRSVTVLHGTTEVPVVAKQADSKLTAGDAQNAAVVTLTSQDPPPGSSDPRRETTASVIGPGRLELFDRDPDTGAVKSSVAQWAKRLDHEKVRNGKGGRTLDLLKFQKDAAFVSPADDFSLRAGDIWLWVANTPGEPNRGQTTAVSGATPEQLVAIADVHLDSTDLVIRKTNKLTAWFDDIAPPKVAAPLAPPAAEPIDTAVLAPPPVPDEVVPAVAIQPAAPPAEPIPNPVYLSADTVEAWLGRYPVPAPPRPPGKQPPAKPAAPKTKYDLLKARCDDNVVAHQDPDPNDPAKPENGMDATGDKLIVENVPGGGGSILTVTVLDDRKKLAMVAFEDTTIWGPVVVIDQPNNTAAVSGRGKLRSLTTSDVAGNELSSPTELIVDWSTRMKFEGAKAFATFLGGVTVQQIDAGDKPRAAVPPPTEVLPAARREVLPAPREAGPVNTATTKTYLWCHQLDLTLDRPVYFNQTRKADRNKANRGQNEPSPKVKTAVAVPDPAAQKPEDKYVIFQEMTAAPNGQPLKARMLTARQMDFDNAPKEQKLFAAGPGELRLLQPHKSDEAKGGRKASDEGEMKLTLVTFQSTMTAVDQGNGMFQEATFDKGGVALRTPTANLLLGLEPHTLPAGSEYLRSDESLVVSSSKVKPDAEAEQRLTAIGNAEFRDDARTGLGDKIVFDGTRVTLQANVGRMASLHTNKRGVNQQQSTRAKKFVYNSVTGAVELTESTGGTILPGK